ncbi:HTTM domain-containing protein [Sneathiella limimaris]|uniref:HTTM domain-containing protein n=1 Tax=Sneathiella limimaris TaxID=1964213 RepID=UPI0019D21BE7|nr:HTTM domain-containing protein [Sneathiella limimaris]
MAVRATEILMGWAFLQQSFEHLWSKSWERYLYLLRAILSLCLLIGVATNWVCLGLFLLGLVSLYRFQGPFNGGSDRMSYLILTCLTLTKFLPNPVWQEIAFGYLALQLVLSYFISGWVKVVNPEWRCGRALADVFAYSAYPVSETLRGWRKKPTLLLCMSWAVIGFELAFPFTLIAKEALYVGLGIAALFHLVNAFLFGLNRFFWIWISAYPSILWLQGRIFAGGLFF